MDRRSEARKLELALELVLIGLKRYDEMPRIRPRVWRAAARLLRLKALEGGWRIEREEGVEPYLEAAGFDKTGHLVDWERYYAYMEAHKPKVHKSLRSHTK